MLLLSYRTSTLCRYICVHIETHNIYTHTWPSLQHRSITAASDGDNKTLHSVALLRIFCKPIISLVIPTDSTKNSGKSTSEKITFRMLLITYEPSALLELAFFSFFAILWQVDKDRSDIQRIGKLEQEKSAPPLGV